MAFWLAVGLNLATIALVYYGLFELLRILYKKGSVWLISFLIFLSPFVYVLTRAGDLLELMWVSLLTPFYAVAVLMLFFTDSVLFYYGMAYGVLALIYFLYHRSKTSQDMFRIESGGKESFDGHCGTKKWYSAKRTRMCLNLALVLVLAAPLIAPVKEGARDPTFQQATEFVALDLTDLNRYVTSVYTCENFAADFRSNAFKAGYICGYVIAYFGDKTHALNCFNTTDHGLIFIEPQSDNIITLINGKPYWDRTIYQPPDYNDTLVGYQIFW